MVHIPWGKNKTLCRVWFQLVVSFCSYHWNRTNFQNLSIIEYAVPVEILWQHLGPDLLYSTSFHPLWENKQLDVMSPHFFTFCHILQLEFPRDGGNKSYLTPVCFGKISLLRGFGSITFTSMIFPSYKRRTTFMSLRCVHEPIKFSKTRPTLMKRICFRGANSFV